MRIREAYLMDDIRSERYAGNMPPTNVSVRRVNIPKVWRGCLYDDEKETAAAEYNRATEKSL